MFKTLSTIATLLALVVVVVGAYVRLEHAGLGCPDWPGCYGQVSPLHASADIAQAVAQQGSTAGPVSIQKAWYEMVHRYLAGTLGVLILLLAVLSWAGKFKLKQQSQPKILPSVLLLTVIMQAALGMWTVTLLLKPVIVTLHLIGGMTTLALLAWLTIQQYSLSALGRRAQPLRGWALFGLVLLAIQISLGGWVSTNYAALICADLPTCQGQWLPVMDFKHGFQLIRELGQTAEGEILSYQALTAIHWTHRVGAMVVALFWVGWLLAAFRVQALRGWSIIVGAALLTQLGVGIGNIISHLNLTVAVAHNAAAALLLMVVVMLNFALSIRSTY